MQGKSMLEFERTKTTWESTRNICALWSKDAARMKFWWEKKPKPKVDLSHVDWSKFTVNENGVEISPEEAKKIIDGSRKSNI